MSSGVFFYQDGPCLIGQGQQLHAQTGLVTCPCATEESSVPLAQITIFQVCPHHPSGGQRWPHSCTELPDISAASPSRHCGTDTGIESDRAVSDVCHRSTAVAIQLLCQLPALDQGLSIPILLPQSIVTLLLQPMSALQPQRICAASSP